MKLDLLKRKWDWTSWHGAMLTFNGSFGAWRTTVWKFRTWNIFFKIALTKSDPHPDTLFWHSFWHIIWTYMWHICSDILSYILFWNSIWHSFWHPIWHLFWPYFLEYTIFWSCLAMSFGLGVLLFAWINANGLNIPQMLVSHVCTQWLPLPLIPQNGQVLNLRVGPEKFSGYWKNRILAQGLKKDVGGRFRYAVGLQSWVNSSSSSR